VPIPLRPGQPARHDYEYERNGTANLFMLFAPLEGGRHVEVTDRHTALDYAQILKALSDQYFPAMPRSADPGQADADRGSRRVGGTPQQEPHEGRLAVHRCRCTHQAETARPGTMSDSGPLGAADRDLWPARSRRGGRKASPRRTIFLQLLPVPLWQRRVNSFVESSGPPRKCKEIRRRSGAATACCSETDHSCAEEREGGWLRYGCRCDKGLKAHLGTTTIPERVGGPSGRGPVIKILASGGGGRVVKRWACLTRRIKGCIIKHVYNK